LTKLTAKFLLIKISKNH